MAFKPRLSAFLVSAIVLASGWLLFSTAPSVRADSSGSGPLAGTYLSTITDANGDFASQSTIIFGADRSMSVVDSTQIVVGFTDSQGSWRRSGTSSFVGVTLNFPTARAEYTGTFDGQTVEGQITLLFFGPGEDPLRDEGTLGGVFDFVAERIVP